MTTSRGNTVTTSLGKLLKIVDDALAVSYDQYIIDIGSDAIYFVFIDDDGFEVEFNTLETDTPDTTAQEVANLMRKVGLKVRIEKD